jgi:hypothetical protein
MILIFWSCSPGSFPISDSLKNNSRKSKIDYPGFFNETKARIFEYQVLERSDRDTFHTDNTIRDGVILPGRSINTTTKIRNSRFISSTDTCRISHKYIQKYDYYGRSALLSVANLFLKSPYKEKQETKTIFLSDSGYGKIEVSGTEDEANFYFENLRRPADLKGWLVINSDSFFIRPVYKSDKIKGIILYDHDKMVAAMERRFDDWVYLANDLTNMYQWLISGYFVVLSEYSRLW